ncbi:hypothetical protein [Bdellovibrio sp. HCB209]|uniref:hypothetical protein n=1 Tax=Bdellovibrio sp. HCB209 TaxID=3394354 RepID=UPI0039B39175
MINLILIFSNIVFAAPSINFDGAYSKPCQKYETVSSSEQLQITDQSWIRSYQLFSDSECAAPSVQTDYSYKVLRTYQMIDMTVLKVQMTAMTESVAEKFNQTNYCGFTDWSVGQSKDVSGVKCGAVAMSSVGSMVYSVLYGEKDSTRKGRIFLGMPSESADGSTEFKRYYVIDPTSFIEN